MMPRDDCLHEGVSASAGGYGNGIVGKYGECSVEILLIDVTQCLDKGIILSVARGSSLILLTVDFHPHIGTRLQSVGGRHHIVDQLHLVALSVMLQHITYDIRQVVLCHNLFLVAQFGDTLSHSSCLFGSEFQPQLLKVLHDVCPARVLAQGVFTFSAKAFWHEVITVQVVLLVTVGMHSCHLCEDVLADDGLIGSNRDTAVALHHPAHLVESVLRDVCLGMELVFQYHLHTGEWSVAASLSQPVHRHMQSLGAAQYRSQ